MIPVKFRKLDTQTEGEVVVFGVWGSNLTQICFTKCLIYKGQYIVALLVSKTCVKSLFVLFSIKSSGHVSMHGRSTNSAALPTAYVLSGHCLRAKCFLSVFPLFRMSLGQAPGDREN